MGVCLLVVNEDITCRHIVSNLLKICNYEEVHTGTINDVLQMIQAKRLPEKNPILISNVQRLGKMGHGIFVQIRRIFNSLTENVALYHLVPDTQELKPKLDQQLSASMYILHILNSEIRAHLKSAMATVEPGGGIYGDDGLELDQNGWRKKRNEETEEHPIDKKARVVATEGSNSSSTNDTLSPTTNSVRDDSGYPLPVNPME